MSRAKWAKAHKSAESAASRHAAQGSALSGSGRSLSAGERWGCEAGGALARKLFQG
jgi:hypothetical protein